MYGGSGYDDGGYGQYGYGSPYGDSGQYGGQYGDGGQYGYGPYGGYGYGPGGYPPQPPRPPRRHALLSHLLVALLAAGVAAGVVLAVSPGTSFSGSASGSGNPVPGHIPGGAQGGAPSAGGSISRGTEQAVINKVEPGMVLINTNLQYTSQAGAGTGMVIGSNGLVLTNNHVIEGSTRIRATVSSGKSYQAKVVGYDKTQDIALIQLQGAAGLHTVPLGNSSSVRRGTSVVALGNADGQGMVTPAAGQITAVNQTITANDPGGAVSAEKLHGMLQTNAGIVSGDSGGPLADTSGRVIGMDTAGNNASVPSQSMSTGFAIPINTALSIAHRIQSGQASSTITIGNPPFMGIFVAQGKSSNPRMQAQQQNQNNNGFGGFGGSGGFGGGQGGRQRCYTSNATLVLPTKIAPVISGSLVDGAICGSPAAKAGLTGGSVITAVNGQAVGAPSQLTGVLAKFHPGQTISVTWVSPSGHKTTSSIHLIAGPPQ